jgi:predicted dehydrogenase
MSQDARYGILLVTGGRTHQENYAAAFAADPRCRLVGLSDESNVPAVRRELNERLARELGIAYLPDIDAALRRRDVHVVSICAEPERRARIAIAAARAGKHLYLDKSLCPRLSDADAIVAAVRQAGVRSHMFSSIPQSWARRAKALLESDTLGELRAIHADAFFAKGKAGTATPGRRREPDAPAPESFQSIQAKRELDNVGVYPISLVRWLAAREYRTVFAVTGNYFFAEYQRHHVEDFAVLAATLDGDIHVTISAGRVGWTSHPAAGVNRVVLVGSKGMAVADQNAPRVEVACDETPWVPPPVNPNDPMGFWKSTQDEVHTQPKRTWLPLGSAGPSDAGYFLDRLDQDLDSEITAADAAVATEVILAAYRSAATGALVRLPLPR